MSELKKFGKARWCLLYDIVRNPFALAYEGFGTECTPFIMAYRLDNKKIDSLYMVDNKQTIQISEVRAKIIAKVYNLPIKNSLRFNPLD